MSTTYTPAQLAAMSVAQLNALSATQFASFSAAQIDALSTAQLNGLSAANFTAINVSYLTKTQIAGLSLTNFDKYIAPNLGSLSAFALQGLTLAQLSSLTPAQVASFSSTQIAAMTTTDSAWVTCYDGEMKDVSAHLSAGTLGFAAARTILQDAASGGMNAGKFAALQAVAKEIDAGGVSNISASAMVKQLFDDVVLGDAANAYWNGGSSAVTALGNLSATSTQAQVNELIGKWFLGTDDPSLAGSPIAAVYKAASGNLFSAAGPTITDVNQGEVGDCYFESALGETALQDPSLIRNMIASDGNGVYTVDFHLDGRNDYVTVNSDLANMLGGYQWYDGSMLEFDNGGSSGALWSAIVEKAYVEFRSQTDGVNAYSDISGGWDNGLSAITGQSVTDYYASNYASASSISSLLNTLNSAFSGKEDALMSTNGGDSALNLVGDHMYAVIGVNLAAGTVTLDNPWNANGAGSGLLMQFTDSLSSLLAAGVTFHVANGSAAVA